MSPERVFIGEEGEAVPCRWTENKKKEREPTVESLLRGIRKPREYQKQSGEYGRVCKIEDIQRDKTSPQCLSADRTQTPGTGLRHPSSNH